MGKSWKIKLYYILAVLMLYSCVSVVRMTSQKMNQLELGMSKEQVSKILGNEYTIVEKRVDDGNQIEILSYQDFYKGDGFYMFLFKNNKLERWYRELYPKYERIDK